MSGVVGFGFGLAGFAALALSQTKHARASLSAAPALAGLKNWPFAWIGWGFVLASTVWCATNYQFGYGLAVLAAALAVAGWAVTLMLSYWPAVVPGAIPSGIVLAVIAWVGYG